MWRTFLESTMKQTVTAQDFKVKYSKIYGQWKIYLSNTVRSYKNTLHHYRYFAVYLASYIAVTLNKLGLIYYWQPHQNY